MLIVLLCILIIDLVLYIVGGSEAVLEQVRCFFEICWLSVSVLLVNLVLFGWLFGV